MASQATPTAEERLQTLLSNQYHRRMHRNRTAWYRDCEPLDTAPKCFKPSMVSWSPAMCVKRPANEPPHQRNDVPLISDWRTYAQVVAFQAKWKAKRFHELHYEINGVVWGWSDPSTDVILGLVTSQTVETIEFIISNDPFRVPHIFVSHSDGEEHHCLDDTGNPDTLNNTPDNLPTQSIPELCGFTPRQSFVGPTGKTQLFLPPRAFNVNDRDVAIIEYTLIMTRRQTTMRRKAGEFHAGLRRIRARHTGGRKVDESGREDLVQTSDEDLVYQGFSERTECPLARLGIFQPEDIAAMAESAVVSSDSEEEDEEEAEEAEELSSTTCAVLRRLGMLDSDFDSESEGDDENDDEDSEATSDNASDLESAALSSSITFLVSSPRAQMLPANAMQPDFSRFISETDEESSVSSLFVDDDSDQELDCESPDTEDSDC
ncbi:hypothetical protein FRC09_020758 [Ceratobasidium sp. 395]|nr:hypothetical protein FRC09_020758 [Ceratobasidium sp. 395]